VKLVPDTPPTFAKRSRRAQHLKRRLHDRVLGRDRAQRLTLIEPVLDRWLCRPVTKP
jgi:hypothetical protein